MGKMNGPVKISLDYSAYLNRKCINSIKDEQLFIFTGNIFGTIKKLKFHMEIKLEICKLAH